VVSFDIRHSDFVIPPLARLFIIEHTKTHTSRRRFVNRNIQINMLFLILSCKSLMRRHLR